MDHRRYKPANLPRVRLIVLQDQLCQARADDTDQSKTLPASSAAAEPNN